MLQLIVLLVQMLHKNVYLNLHSRMYIDEIQMNTYVIDLNIIKYFAKIKW